MLRARLSLAEVNEATIRVLQRNGYEVRFPRLQTCCGAAALHLGEKGQAVRQARQNIDAFLSVGSEDVVAIINNAGGCGATLKEYPHLLQYDPDYADKACLFAARVQDISEFLADHLTISPLGVLRRGTYSIPAICVRTEVVRNPRITTHDPGLELVELSKPDRCCGSAGVYNITQWETAEAVLAEKMVDIQQTGAETVVATNTGCYLQLVYGAAHSSHPLQVTHLVNLLDESYRVAEAQQAEGKDK